jgi:serine-type D-Ala-D-Ala carboxypeptidase
VGVVPPVKDCSWGEVDLGSVAEGLVHQHRAAPCAAVGAAIREAGRWRLGSGYAGRLSPAPAPGEDAPLASADTLFDLASLTKPVMALTLARAERRGQVRRAQPLGELVPALGSTPSGPVPLDLLAAHRAGLEAHRELFVAELGAIQPTAERALGRAANERRPECRGPAPVEGFPPVYSDLGYMLLGAALSAATGLALDDLVRQEVAEPLGLRLGSARAMAAACGSHAAFVSAAAPTEIVPWRGGVLRGVVHDENAWVLGNDGLAGHAGAFADLPSVVLLGVAVLDALAGRRPEWLAAAELEPLLRRRPGGTHCAGFDRRGGDAPMSGQHFGPETFGHLGFTGTSIWIDPERELCGVVLSNRVHPTRDSSAIRTARPAAYDGIYRAMTGS